MTLFSALEFLLARNLTVSLVTCCSAVFHWKHEPKNNIHDVQFLLHCNGKRNYVNVHKKLVEENHLFDLSNPSTSKDVETVLAENLEANTNYECTMSSVSGTLQSPPSRQVSFATLPGGKYSSDCNERNKTVQYHPAPSTPPTPVLSLSQDHTFTASLYPTDERFGDIR